MTSPPGEVPLSSVPAAEDPLPVPLEVMFAARADDATIRATANQRPDLAAPSMAWYTFCG